MLQKSKHHHLHHLYLNKIIKTLITAVRTRTHHTPREKHSVPDKNSLILSAIAFTHERYLLRSTNNSVWYISSVSLDMHKHIIPLTAPQDYIHPGGNEGDVWILVLISFIYVPIDSKSPELDAITTKRQWIFSFLAASFVIHTITSILRNLGTFPE